MTQTNQPPAKPARFRLQPDVQKIGDWIEQQGRVTAAHASGANVVDLKV